MDFKQTRGIPALFWLLLAAGTALLGILILKEPATAARIACILLIVAGVIGLKLATKPG